MSIKSRILSGMMKSRKKKFSSSDLDKFAAPNFLLPNLWPTTHGVRARISELTASGDIKHVARGTYILGDRDE